MNRWIVHSSNFAKKNFQYPRDTAVTSEWARESRYKERNERMRDNNREVAAS